MKVTFLGTGTSQGIPVIGSRHPVCLSEDPRDKRLRSSVLLQWKDKAYTIDCGPDFRQQILCTGIERLDGVLFTHFHADHTAGLDDIRPFSHRQGEVQFYADTSVIENIQERFAYIFAKANRYVSAPRVALNEISYLPFTLGDRTVIPIKVMHGAHPIFGFRIGDFAYITDAKSLDEKEQEKLKGLKVLVVNALRKEPHPTHFNLEEALEFIGSIGPEKAYLTHISHQLGFHREVSEELPPGVFLAYDGLELQLD